jgi:iron-sulfur cluster repair protein YtfE (RIC family)
MEMADPLHLSVGTTLQAVVYGTPLEALRFEHFKQRLLCDMLGRIVDDLHGRDTVKNAAWVLSYLENDLPLHVSDEAEDLVPLLLEHADTDGAVGEACDALVQEHESDEPLMAEVTAGLERLAGEWPLERPLDFIIRALMFEEKLRRHLAWENATLLPLARRFLGSADISSLRRRMASRHGLS